MNKAYLLSCKPQSLHATSIKNFIVQQSLFQNIQDGYTSIIQDTEFLKSLEERDYLFLLDLDHTYADMVSFIRQHTAVKVIVILKINLLESNKIKSILENHSVGVVNLNAHIDCLSECIHSLSNKDYYMCDYTKDWVINNIIEGKGEATFKNFNKNELKILELAKKGYNIDMTAEEMDLSRNTVAAYRSKMLRKATAKSFSELVYLSSKNEQFMHLQ